MRWIALLFLVAVAACADETTLAGAPLGWGPASGTLYVPPASGDGIVGDWFFCEDAACAQVAPDGLRFEAEGTWDELWDQEDHQLYLPGDRYCFASTGQPYTWDGSTLTIHGMATVDGPSDVTCGVTLYEDVARLDCVTARTVYLRRANGQQVEECPVPVAGD